MPRNGVGTFGVLTPILIGALRSSAVVNADFDDAGDELTNSMPLAGTAAMTGQLKSFEGSVIEPGTSWSADTNTGFRRSAIDEVRWVAGGQDRVIMDANGKMTLLNGISVTGSVNLSAVLAPHSLRATGQSVAILRRKENDTSEHEIETFESGSGSGAKGSLRVVGGGANDVQTMRFYVNDIKTFEWTQNLFSVAVSAKIGTSGFQANAGGSIDFPEVSSPSSPAANIGRLYSRDVSGVTKMFYKDSDGTERGFTADVDRQTFTSSGTWTKPGTGSVALIEVWAAGGGGSSRNDGGGGGGGGAHMFRKIALSSLSASVAITVGSGGASNSDGGNSSFGAYMTAYGGLAGGQVVTTSGSSGGPGGGLLAKGSSENGGRPRGFIGFEEWGDGTTIANNSNPFGGGATAFGSETAGAGLLGGGGGGGSDSDGAPSVWGGAGGGGEGSAGGFSLYGGAGGAGGFSGVGSAGTIPAGGGGGGGSAFKSPFPAGGAGARGEIRITVW